MSAKETEATPPVPVCGIGASAGGVGALRSLFQQLPTDLDLAYVVILHLAPDHPSAMNEILAAATTMPVHQVTDSPKLKPNCVYVIPPDRELIIEEDAVQAHPFTEARGQRAPIDMLFRSIAASRGDGMAVILTGSGSDGALGSKAVKEAGGVVFVQDPMEAEFPSMPRSAIAGGDVDFVETISGLAERIAEVARSKEAVRSLDTDRASNELRRIINFLHARTGHDFSNYKRTTVMRRVLRRMQVQRMTSLKDYAEFLKETPEEATELFRDMLISVTQFFRDADAFDVLAHEAVDEIFDDLKEEGIRVWVAGCATGEEAYSIAILIREEAERRNIKVPVQIFATDLDEGALATARAGRYPRTIEADVSEERLRRFFIEDGTHYRVRSEIREMVLFATHSVLKDPPFLRLDLVSCRNLLIYLERSLHEKLCSVFYYALRPHRYLFLGSAETADAASELFASVDREARLFCTRPQGARALPLMTQRYGFAAHSMDSPSRTPTGGERGGMTPAAVHAAVLEKAAPPSILVSETYHIVHMSPSAGRYILHSGRPFSAKVDAIVRPELRLDLSHALARAMERKLPTLTMATPVAFNGQRHRVAMNIVPEGAEKSTAEQALILFLDGGVIEADEELDAHEDVRPDEIRRMHAELKSAQESLATSRSEYELAIQELRAANEELQSMNEEYRSTSEELETSKEELQSMNEELQTVNAELKSKLESISTAHSHLRNLTAATEIGTMFLDRELRIRMFTPPVADLFNIAESDIGRSLTDFTHHLRYSDIEKDVRKVLDELSALESEVQNADGRWFMMRVRPYRTVEDRIDGVVMSFVDISSRRKAEDQLRESESRYRTLFNSLEQGFCVIEMIFDDAGTPVDYRFLDVNAAFERQTGLTDPIGKTIKSLEPNHEPHWFEYYGRIAMSRRAEHFEAPAKPLGDYFYEVYAFPFGEPDEKQVGILFQDIRERKEAEKERELLTQELSHRVKNTLAVVQAMAHQTARSTDSVEEFRKSFDARLEAFSHAHEVLLETQWQSADMRTLVNRSLEAYGGNEIDAVSIDGEAVELTPKQGLGLALILHELATNAAKYGALSVPDGRLKVRWSVKGEKGDEIVHFRWTEENLPPVKTPRKKGFGIKLVERSCGHELGGTAELKFLSGGFTADIKFPVRLESHDGPGANP